MTTTATTYEVVVTREGSNWLADVPSVHGAHTFARTLNGLLKSVREVIVLMDDLPDDANPDVTLTFDVPDDLVTSAAEVAIARRTLATYEQEVQQKTARLAADLLAHDYTVRDTATILGVSPGRISQLVSA